MHVERHKSHRAGWLRASVLGANDGTVSTASLVLGVAAADAATGAILTAGLAGLVGGALSMAVGEYVSVSSQRDTERADLARETRELEEEPERELEELTGIYQERGLSRELAHAVAVELSRGDRLAVHAREELGIEEERLARPMQAALSSALSFALGAALPLVVMVASPMRLRMALTLVVAALSLGLLGGLAARLGGAPVPRAVARVIVGGVLAMGLTAALGALFGVVV